MGDKLDLETFISGADDATLGEKRVEQDELVGGWMKQYITK